MLNGAFLARARDHKSSAFIDGSDYVLFSPISASCVFNSVRGFDVHVWVCGCVGGIQMINNLVNCIQLVVLQFLNGKQSVRCSVRESCDLRLMSTPSLFV